MTYQFKRCHVGSLYSDAQMQRAGCKGCIVDSGTNELMTIQEDSMSVILHLDNCKANSRIALYCSIKVTY